MYYDEQEICWLNVPVQDTQTITIHLQGLMALKVKCKDPQGNPAKAYVRLYKQVGGNWPDNRDQEGETSLVGDDQIWASTPLSPGMYRVKAKVKDGPNPPWVDSGSFNVSVGIEQNLTITVPGEGP